MVKIKVRYIILFVLLLLCYGSWYLAENYIFKSVPEVVEEYYSEKYGGNFTWVSYVEEKNTENSRVSTVEDSNGILFTVERYYDTDGTVHYRDNYYGYKHESEIYSLLRDNIPLSYNFTLSIENSNLPEVKDSSIDVVDFCRNSDTILSLAFKSNKNLSKEDMSEIVNALDGITRISACVIVSGSEEQQFAMDENYNLIIR